jgi:hypothetical protein
MSKRPNAMPCVALLFTGLTFLAAFPTRSVAG